MQQKRACLLVLSIINPFSPTSRYTRDKLSVCAHKKMHAHGNHRSDDTSLRTCAVIQNVDKLQALIVLAFLYMYLQMVFAMFLIKDGINQDFCSNMFQCIQTMTDITIRDYGVFDVLGYAEDIYRYPSNIIDAMGIAADMREAGVYFIKKFLWDIPFQIMFAYVMISIVCGIIVDAFTSLKEAREKKEEDLDTYCFVCNLEQWRLDQVSSMRRRIAPTALPPRDGIFFVCRAAYNLRSPVCDAPSSFNAYVPLLMSRVEADSTSMSKSSTIRECICIFSSAYIARAVPICPAQNDTSTTRSGQKMDVAIITGFRGIRHLVWHTILRTCQTRRRN
jgi:hypothetical protein